MTARSKRPDSSYGDPAFGVASQAKKPIVVSDWEGPWVFADHAYDAAKAIIPRGDELFPAIGNYAIFLADVRKLDRFQPGATLSLIAPFLIAYGADDRFLYEMAEQDARFIKGAKEAIGVMQGAGSSFWVVSTSYHQYVWHTAPLVGIPQERTRCTFFPIEDLRRQAREVDRALVKEMREKVIDTQKFKLDTIRRADEVAPNARAAIEMLDRFFLDILPATSFGPCLTILPTGGQRKLDALREILRIEGRSGSEAVVLGDSITDRNMLKETKENKGLAISFNGNRYAIDSANVAIASTDCMVTPVLIQIFSRSGISEVEHVTTNWDVETLKREVSTGNLDQKLFDRVFVSGDQIPPLAYWVTEENAERVLGQSLSYRNRVRGAAGKLT